MPYLTKEQRNELGPIVQKHERAGDWTPEVLDFCAGVAKEMLRGNKRALGLRAGRPKREVLMSSDFIDEAHLKFRRGPKRRTA